ncbi:protein kinase [Streptomyces acidicola]|uniref:protein kinase n=1 Tax=Streptomyces acidicola TaxID=2596892 RepID=UPI00343C918B
MDDYAGRVLADRYRLPLPPSDEYELAETRAFDTYSGQEVLLRQVPLPEIVEAEVLDADGLPDGYVARDGRAGRTAARTTRRPTDPAVRRAIEAAQAAAQIPDHPRLDQVFDVFAESGSLWIVSELVGARPLAALLAEQPLTPYRAAEVAADVLTALRALHAHGWVHRNITARTVLVCDDGRVVLSGLAAGAAEEALCGYDPVPVREFEGEGPPGEPRGTSGPSGASGSAAASADGGRGGPDGGGSRAVELRGPQGGAPLAGGADPETARRVAIEARAAGGAGPVTDPDPSGGQRVLDAGGDVRAARAGAIAAYRAGARAAARVHEEQQGDQSVELPAQRPAPAHGEVTPASGQGAPYTPPGQIADPYGVARPNPWHGALPRAGAPAADGNGQGRPALPGSDTGARGGESEAHGTRNGAPEHGGPGGPGGPGTGTYGGGALGGGTQGQGVPGSGAYGADPLSKGAPASPPYGNSAPAPAPYGDSAPTPWGQTVPTGAPRRGPATALAAERARQARMAVVGPVTERWAPEQAGPVHENWQLAAPIGPSTDLWALGALLFRAVQGHAPYPEENTAELVQLVCSEPPAFAEECGPLRPVVESLLRQDPTERLDFEELRGWLRSLVRSAPEPEAGAHVIAAPPAEPNRLPIVRRRGWLVPRRRAGLPAAGPHARHRRAKQDRPSRSPRPRSLGRNLLLVILLALAAAIAYAMVFMPKAGSSDVVGTGSGPDTGRTGAAEDVSPAPEASSEPRPDQTSPADDDKSPSGSSGSAEEQGNGQQIAQGFTLRKDSEGFQVAVARGWDRTPKNGRGQIVYAQGGFQLIVVPGRDSAGTFGSDPLAYQREDERELQPFRDSTWATSSGMRLIEVGGRSMAEGQFTWQDSTGSEIFVRNLAILINGRYHVVQLRGPEAERDEVTRLFEQASSTYRVTD